MTHVDHFIDDCFRSARNERYARFVLSLFRAPGTNKYEFSEWTDQFKLFCDFEGKKWRVVGASRMGDIWLHSDHNHNSTTQPHYEKRVEIDQCSNWSES